MSGELQNLREGIADSYDVQSLAALRYSNSIELTKARMLACWRGSIREERSIFDANQLHLCARVEVNKNATSRRLACCWSFLLTPSPPFFDCTLLSQADSLVHW